MPITHIQNKEFDFSSATFEKKKDLVKILMEKQKSFTNSIRNIPIRNCFTNLSYVYSHDLQLKIW